jgi:hypothetical protein
MIMGEPNRPWGAYIAEWAHGEYQSNEVSSWFDQIRHLLSPIRSTRGRNSDEESGIDCLRAYVTFFLAVHARVVINDIDFSFFR